MTAAIELWRGSSAASRMAAGWALAATLVAGLPVVGLAVAITAIVLGRRARALPPGTATSPEPDRLATIALLLAVLATLLATVFTSALLVLLALG